MTDVTEVDGSSPAVGKYFHCFLFYSIYFNVLTDMCKLKLTEFTIKSCLTQNIIPKPNIASVLLHPV